MTTFTPLWPLIEPHLANAQPKRTLPRPNGEGWIVGLRSPLRPDKHPGSFAIHPDSVDDPGGFKDFATNETGSMAELAKRLGIDPRVSQNHHCASSEQQSVYYDYRDADGKLLYQVVRYYRSGKKQFYQRRPDGNGGWIKDLRDVPRVLYRLPEVLDAVERGLLFSSSKARKTPTHCMHTDLQRQRMSAVPGSGKNVTAQR